MNLSKQHLGRIANAVRSQLQILAANRQEQVQKKVADLIGHMERLRAIRRKLSICHTRAWRAAAARLTLGVEAALRDIPYHVQQVEQAIQACRKASPSLGEVYEELVQVDNEFGELRYHAEGELLAVVTEPIELEDIFLGDFEVQLRVPGLAEMRHGATYRIVALDPHPAASNECVTHPHVSDEQLCAGDAGAAIQAALSTGRICDFFVLVRSVLTHYNPDSPYVSLDNWYGTSCHDCGYVVDREETYFCASCEYDFCSECSSYCRLCDETICLGCLENCPVCNDPVCTGCMTTCPDCGERLCQNCVNDLACPCHQEPEENEDDPSEHTTRRQVLAVETPEEQANSIDVIRQAARATVSTVGGHPA